MGREAGGRPWVLPAGGQRPWRQGHQPFLGDGAGGPRVAHVQRRRRGHLSEILRRETDVYAGSRGVCRLRPGRARHQPHGLSGQGRQGRRRGVSGAERSARLRRAGLSLGPGVSRPLRDRRPAGVGAHWPAADTHSQSNPGQVPREQGGRDACVRNRRRRPRRPARGPRFHDQPPARFAQGADDYGGRRVLRVSVQPGARALRRAEAPRRRAGRAAVVHAQGRHDHVQRGRGLRGPSHADDPQRGRDRRRRGSRS